MGLICRCGFEGFQKYCEKGFSNFYKLFVETESELFKN